MRLFEVDQGSARDVLAVLQGLAKKQNRPSQIPFAAVLNLIRPFGLGISTPDGLVALKNQVDPAGDVIKDILDDGTVVLDVRSGIEPESDTGPSVDAMASSGAKKLEPDL